MELHPTGTKHEKNRLHALAPTSQHLNWVCNNRFSVELCFSRMFAGRSFTFLGMVSNKKVSVCRNTIPNWQSSLAWKTKRPGPRHVASSGTKCPKHFCDAKILRFQICLKFCQFRSHLPCWKPGWLFQPQNMKLLTNEINDQLYQSQKVVPCSDVGLIQMFLVKAHHGHSFEKLLGSLRLIEEQNQGRSTGLGGNAQNGCEWHKIGRLGMPNAQFVPYLSG